MCIRDRSGPDHDKLFISGVFIDNRMLGKGSGKSKKESEQRAAQAAVELLREKDVERDISLTQSLIKKEDVYKRQAVFQE